MISGIFHVRFHTQIGMGEGLAVFQNGKVNGGDPGYLYLGDFEISDRAVKASLTIKRWNPAWKSVFGPIDTFPLELTGELDPSEQSFTATGGIPGQPQVKIRIDGRKISEVA